MIYYGGYERIYPNDQSQSVAFSLYNPETIRYANEPQQELKGEKKKKKTRKKKRERRM